MSMRFFAFFVMLLISSLSFAIELKNYQLINGCTIREMNGRTFKTFPGQICIFMENGSFVSATENHLRLINKKSEVVWEIPGHFHHQINLSSDSKRILAISSKIINVMQIPVRQDHFVIVNLEGKILHEQIAREIFQQAGLMGEPATIPLHLKEIFKVENEISHFNSFYEIPQLSGSDHPSYLKEGNYIVNGTGSGFFILSSDLKKVLHHEQPKISYLSRMHDVQVTSQGNYLIFNNLVATGKGMIDFEGKGPGPFLLHSAIMELKPSNLKIVNQFEATPKSIFYSALCGGIQELDKDTWLFSDVMTGTYIYSKKKKDFLTVIPWSQMTNGIYSPTQQIKAQDLTSFLDHWK
jgi:hypothetical protein